MLRSTSSAPPSPQGAAPAPAPNSLLAASPLGAAAAASPLAAVPTSPHIVEVEGREVSPPSATRVSGRERQPVDRLGAKATVPKPKPKLKGAIKKPTGGPRGPRGSYISKALREAGLTSGKSTELPLEISGRHLGALS